MIHKCSPCGREFTTEADYLAHECSAADNFKPGTPEYLKKTTTPHFDKVAEAAQKRGADKKEA